MSLVEDISRIEPKKDVYEVCQLGKQTRLPFPINKAWRAHERLQLVHTDICGPMKTTSLNGNSCKLKCLRSDNRTEYVSQRFQKICDDAGIQHQLTTIYTPQQNGVCERKNRTVLDMASANKKRTKLEKRSMPGVFVGYSSVKKGYRIFDPSTKKIIPAEIKVEAEDDYDDAPIRGTKNLTDIYERCAMTLVEPSCYAEAAKESCWQEAMEAELKMIQKNDTWELVNRLANRKVIGVKWVFRTKNNAEGSLNKHKARLVVKGHSQQQGVDFFETFAPVTRLDTIRLLFALPEGFEVPGEEHKVYKLKKTLYGLKQTPRAWYDRIDAYLSRLGFTKSISEPTLYVKKAGEETLLIVSLYVDVLLVTGSKDVLIEDFKKQMQDIFEMTDLGLMTYFLGMEVNQKEQSIFISQQAFALKVLSKFSMSKCKPASTSIALGEKLSSTSEHDRVDEKGYRSLVGCLLYLIATRPDTLYAVSLLSRFMHCCNIAHFKAAKRVLRYVKGTLNFGVKFGRAEELKLVGYSDSDWAEAEYIVATTAINQAIWLRKLLDDLNASQIEATEIKVDN
ncbi:hypothetical protein CXB51_011146 [Gossypium anomalum]|uniref:Integrase catalytic domain-containing protein n=1 Tax=Gossypium anomalum TaxID=47600 RepID=A0A8J6D078_9ROSI|nr:hypothetical protein CXB51_011146 [Gossypium anomalum]